MCHFLMELQAMLYKAEERVGKIQRSSRKRYGHLSGIASKTGTCFGYFFVGVNWNNLTLCFWKTQLDPDNFDAMAQVASASRIPIATGERIHNIFEFQMLLERRAAIM